MADFGSVPTYTAPSRTPAEPLPQSHRTEKADDVRSGRAGESATEPADPTSLSIPRLRVRAPVDQVGVAEDGQVVVPENPDRVGWYRFSPLPGAGAGSSVIVGHVDAAGGGLGVLAALGDIRKGDEVLVGRRDGTTATFRVAARRTLAKASLGASGVFRRGGTPVLTLVTCAGPYVRGDGGYQNNLVVTAVEVPR
ncbi:class F sortase [Streptomyces sp. NPDC093089]|uniref:class F sortase n=1 Tax=Streptomyces sp. NPDC093089 TaxID=3366024 RepID=UPI00380E5A8D